MQINLQKSKVFFSFATTIHHLDGKFQNASPMKPTIILETSYKDVGNMMWWGFRNAPRFKSQKALYLLLSGAERSKHNIFSFILSSLRWKAAKPSALAQRTKQETSYSGQSWEPPSTTVRLCRLPKQEPLLHKIFTDQPTFLARKASNLILNPFPIVGKDLTENRGNRRFVRGLVWLSSLCPYGVRHGCLSAGAWRITLTCGRDCSRWLHRPLSRLGKV